MKHSKPLPIKSCFAPPKEGYRSVNIKLDYGNPRIIGSYLPTHKSLGVLDAIFEGVHPQSRQRASAVIAPYGSGKSSLLLLLSALLENPEPARRALSKVRKQIERLSPSLAQAIAKQRSQKKGHLVVILSGEEGSLELAFRLGLKEALERRGLTHVWRKLLSGKGGKKSKAVQVHDSLPTIDLYKRTAEILRGLGYQGIFVAYDEFGKVLEGQQINPRPGDLFFLQSFAELCSRSGKNQIHLMLSLHQGFAQYAHRLPIYVRNEWAKIEGRFRIFHYVEDSLQVYNLIAQAVKKLHATSTESLTRLIDGSVKSYAKASKANPAFSAFGSAKELQKLLNDVYPLDPIALYVLPRLSARVAQNERTLFHFLLGQERNCLCPILQQLEAGTSVPFLRAADLFEYFSDLMIKDTGVGGTYRRYVEIKTALGRVNAEDYVAQAVIKTIGILSIINEPDKLPPSLEVVEIALGALNAKDRETLRSTLDHLVKNKILLYRRHNNEYRIWEGSDVDVVGLLRQKKAEYERHFNPVAFLASKLPAPYTLAHRYNEDFGLVRYFEASFISADEIRSLNWNEIFGDFRGTDGRIYFVIADTQPEIDEAVKAAQEVKNKQAVFAIPRFPFNFMEPLLELYCLEQLLADSGFVHQDPVLQRELSELADDCLSTVQRKVVRLFEPRYQETIWIHRGESREDITSRARLKRLVSDICLEVFPSTPRFYNELINRRNPSATIVNSRKKLLRAMLENRGAENLGLTGFGPEVSIFRALLRNTGLYQPVRETQYGFAGSEHIKDARLRKTIKTIEDYLHDSTGHPRSMGKLVEQLVSPPIGLREGVLPILFGAVFQAFPLPLNVMDEGIFVKELKAETFERMLLTPDKVTVQCVKLPDEIGTYLAALPSLFAQEAVQVEDSVSQRQLLQYALEAIYRWVHQLPSCAMTTQRLSSTTLELRTTLVKATDPVALVLNEIPQVYLGDQKDLGDGNPRPISEQGRRAVLKGLKDSIEELNSYKSQVAAEVTNILYDTFADQAQKQEESLIETLRQWVGKLTNDIKDYLDDPQCSGLITRIMSNYETDQTMVESLASLVTGRSISYWDDTFLRQFELGLLAIHKKITDTDRLLRSRKLEKRLLLDPDAWTVRIERGGETAGQLIIKDSDPSDSIMTVKDKVGQVLRKRRDLLTPEERRRVLLELLKEEL